MYRLQFIWNYIESLSLLKSSLGQWFNSFPISRLYHSLRYNTILLGIIYQVVLSGTNVIRQAQLRPMVILRVCHILPVTECCLLHGEITSSRKISFTVPWISALEKDSIFPYWQQCCIDLSLEMKKRIASCKCEVY